MLQYPLSRHTTEIERVYDFDMSYEPFDMSHNLMNL